MSDHWEFYSTYIGGSPAFVSYDHGIQESLHSLPVEQCIRFDLTYKSPRCDGLPTNEEFDVAVAIEDEIMALAAVRSGVYAGRVTVNGQRRFFAYFGADVAALESFASGVRRKFGYDFEVSVLEDPKKSLYWNLLFPSDAEWEEIRNQKVIDVLEDHGDPIEKPRRIDHWANFDEKEALDRFRVWVSSQGYEIESVIEPDDETTRFGLQFYRVGLPELKGISETTLSLRVEARKAGGEYDGWETFVVTE